MKKLIIGLIVAAVAGAVTAGEQKGEQQKSYDPDLWLKNSLRLNGSINGLAVGKKEAEHLVSLPREVQVDPDSAVILGSDWVWVSDDERVVILFTGGLRKGLKVLDIRGK